MRDLTKIFALVALLIVSATSNAESACKASSTSCGMYACLENRIQCGPQGYLTNFGGRLCQRYLDHQGNVSPALKTWFPKVRLCLQMALLNLQEVSSCDDLEKKAFATHFDCYARTGFCELNAVDKLELFQQTGIDGVLGPSSIEVGIRIEEFCNRK